MTTTDTALTEQIARALRRYDAETNGWSDRMLLTVTVRDYLPSAAAVLPLVRTAQAEAWDEGHRDTMAYIASGNLNDDEHHAEPTNPYRTEETTP